MADQKLTDWYEPEQRPVRAGMYQRDFTAAFGAGLTGAHEVEWNGIKWVAKNGRTISQFQSLPWRGLSVDPNAGYITVRIPRPEIVDGSAGYLWLGYYKRNNGLVAANAVREAMK